MGTIICCDRDGTINVDSNFYLGSSENWKEQIQFMPGVIKGLQVLQKNGAALYIVTNQSGVALKGKQFSQLTIERMHEVNAHIIDLLKEHGIIIATYFACPYVDKAYAEKAKQRGHEIHEEFLIDKHEDIKPNIGMLRKALDHAHKSQLVSENKEKKIIVIGDRFSDMQLAINANAKGILIESEKTKELNEYHKIKELKNICIAKDFYHAATLIVHEGY